MRGLSLRRVGCGLLPGARARATCILLLGLLGVFAAQAQEFANLTRYQAQNLKALSSGSPIDVVFIGDSITDRWPRERPQFFADTGRLGRGVVSETTPQILLRFRQDVIELKPATVVILAGTNDIAGNSGSIALEATVGYLQSMVELARANGIRPILCTVLPAARYPWSPDKRPDQDIPRLNGLLQAYAESAGVPLVNLYSIMSDGRGGMRTAFSEDGVHPNSLGYSVMERKLEEILP